MNGLEISPFIASLPKVELHIHIEGTLLPALRWKLAKRNNMPLQYETYEALLDSYKVFTADCKRHSAKTVLSNRPTATVNFRQ
ncbi:adenosine deaminase [Colletotrichum cuscutae]|uniref:Adenosine deaminase n=1 Tax=Colletotrichum cuscutae TaxID=1209917 RepID=A0AAI9TXH0_9PEZI|nr:adenosine deaminase [Colletotrichum cuscutae]